MKNTTMIMVTIMVMTMDTGMNMSIVMVMIMQAHMHLLILTIDHLILFPEVQEKKDIMDLHLHIELPQIF